MFGGGIGLAVGILLWVISDTCGAGVVHRDEHEVRGRAGLGGGRHDLGMDRARLLSGVVERMKHQLHALRVVLPVQLGKTDVRPRPRLV